MAKAIAAAVVTALVLGGAALLIGRVFSVPFLTANAWIIAVGGLVGGVMAMVVGRGKP